MSIPKLPAEPQHPIVEPLSEATCCALTPLRLKDQDYLFVRTTEDGKAFIMEPKGCRRLHPLEKIEDFAPDAVRRTVEGEDVLLTNRSSSFSAREFFQRIPEKRDLGQDNWKRYGQHRVAATDYTAVVLYHSWPTDRIIFLDEAARLQYELLLKRFLRQTARARLQAHFKVDGAVPTMPDDYLSDDERVFPAADYQKAAVAMSIGQEGTALFMDRGTGKTYVTIDRICLEANRTREGRMPGRPAGMMRVLIIAPLQVRLNWQREFEKFAWTPGKITILRGGIEKRVQQLTHACRTEDDCSFSAVVVSYDTAVRDMKFLRKIPWDFAVLDESHRIKGHYTKRWQKIKELRGCSARRQVLTGTPYANTINDLWTQLEFLGHGLSGFSTAKEFYKWHTKILKEVDGRAVMSKMNNLPLMHERLSRLSFQITKEEAGLKLPPKVYDVAEVEMTPRQAEFYRQMATQLAVEIRDMLSGGLDESANRAVSAENILTKLLRLAQITSGHITWDAAYDDYGEVIREKQVEQISPNKNPKIEWLIETLRAELQEDPKAKKLIWGVFIPDIREISRALKEAGIDHVTYYGATSERARQEAVDRFNNDPTLRVMVANPQTAGEGLNLLGYDQDHPKESDTYCDHLIIFSANWSHILRAQLEDRAHRRGTRVPLQITDLMVPGTIDEEIRSRVALKAKNAALVYDIRAILENVLDVVLDVAVIGG